MIVIKDYFPEITQDLASIYYNTIHKINIRNYTQEQVEVWAPKNSLEPEKWTARFLRTKPIIAIIGDQVVGFVEFELSGYIDCFYCHHDWIGKGVGSALMNEVFSRAKVHNVLRVFSEVSITAKPFFEKQGFVVVQEQTVLKKGVGLINYKMEKYL